MPATARTFQLRQPLQPDIRQSLDDALDETNQGDGALIARVRQRVLVAVAQKTSLLHRTVRAEAGVWEPVAPGVERKPLWDSGQATSCLIRLAPGAVFPAHDHPLDEECVVLEGSLRIGADLLLRVGDFHVGVKGVVHDVVGTQEGCLCFLRTARCFFEAAA